MAIPSISESEYKKKLEDKLKYISFGDESKKSFYFDELFYPVRIEEGSCAFDNYANQMVRAHQLDEEAKFDDHPLEQLDTVSKKLSNWSFAEEPESEPETETDAEPFLDYTSPDGSDLSAVSPIIVPASSDEDGETSDGNGNSKDDSRSSDEKMKGAAASHPLPLILDKITNANRSFNEPSVARMYYELGYRVFDDTVTSPDINYLETEHDYDHSSLIVGKNETASSRILVIASAGHGKTTLLERVALYYSRVRKNGIPKNNFDKTLSDIYKLSGSFLPCIIKLRNIHDDNYSIPEIIEKSITDVFFPDSEIEPDETTSAAIKSFAEEMSGRLLLLIDGLDEFSTSARKLFIDKLEEYVSGNPAVRIIMSTRVAGLSEPGITEALKRMSFRGRSIMPLTDSEAEKYSVKWIEKTQPADSHKEFKDALNRILHENRFRYLREFLRTPLELIVLLKQISSKKLALNKFRLFYDMLWGLFTNHTESSGKQTEFDDDMHFVSFIAYKMQAKDSMFFSYEDIEASLDEIKEITFFGLKEQTADSFREWLDNLSANVGIIEKTGVGENSRYTFPIRAYQEYLAAYCCCHLRLGFETSSPTPAEILKSHINESRWLSIISYALSDLNNANGREVEYSRFVNLIFEKMDISPLETVIESDIKVKTENAALLFERLSDRYRVDAELESILTTCMTSQSAAQYSLAIDGLLVKHSDSRLLLEAAAMKDVLWCYNKESSALDKATEYLHNKKTAARGAQMLIFIAKAKLGEQLSNIKDAANEDLIVSPETAQLLYKNALANSDITSVTALALLWLSGAKGSECIKPLLCEELSKIVYGELTARNDSIQKVFKTIKNPDDCPEYPAVLELIYTLGTFPVVAANAHMMLPVREEDRHLSILLDYLFHKSVKDTSLNPIALACAGLFYDKTIDDFITMWGSDICRDVDSEHISMEMYSKRTANHFRLIRGDLIYIEAEYKKQQMSKFPNGTTVFTLFRDGRIKDAARFCIDTMDSVAGSSHTNLAFLIRYGNLTQMDLGDNYRISELLADGIAKNEPFALINMALYECECENFERAAELLSHIDSLGWNKIKDFWYKDMWVRNKISTPEGALVCVMAQQRSNCRFEDYADMLKVARHFFADYPDTVFKKA